MQKRDQRQEKNRVCFFFFQAEDGIRDIGVTGVQTCALPILTVCVSRGAGGFAPEVPRLSGLHIRAALLFFLVPGVSGLRSEERRVGKECRSRWSPYH